MEKLREAVGSILEKPGVGKGQEMQRRHAKKVLGLVAHRGRKYDRAEDYSAKFQAVFMTT